MKKRIGLVIVILIIGYLIAANAIQGTATGTTTATYVAAVDVYTADHDNLLFIIRNTGTDSTMYFSAWGYALNGGDIYNAVVTDSAVACTTSTILEINSTAYANVEIYVKNNSGTTTYQIDYCLK